MQVQINQYAMFSTKIYSRYILFANLVLLTSKEHIGDQLPHLRSSYSKDFEFVLPLFSPLASPTFLILGFDFLFSCR